MSKSLIEACNITTGKLDSNAFIKNGKYPFFTCSPECLYINNYAFDADAVLLAGNNASGNFNIKRYKGKFNAYQRTYILTAKNDFDIDFVYYSLKMELAHFKRIAQGSQTKFLTISILNGFRIENIGKKVQKERVAILKSLDAKIELNNKICSELESLAQDLYHYWFTQFDFPNENGKPYHSSGGKMVWNEELAREIPKGWGTGSLLDIAKFSNGIPCQKYRPTSIQKIPVIKIKEMHEGINNETEYVRLEIPKEALIHDGDLLFSWSASLEVKIWVGGTGALNQHIFKVTSQTYGSSFLLFQLLDYLQHFRKIAENRKTTMGHITRDHLEQSLIIIPPKTIVNKLENIIDPLLRKIVLLRQESLELAKVRDFLLPLLINGQVSVSK